jgi:hypothetical protein
MAALLPPSPEDGMIDGQQSHPTIIPEKILTDLVGPHPTQRRGLIHDDDCPDPPRAC